MRPPPSPRRAPSLCSHVGRHFLGFALVAALPALLDAGRAEAAKRLPAVKYHGTRYLGEAQGRLYFRGAFEITSPPQRSYHVTFQLRLNAKQPLQFRDIPKSFWTWGKVTIPRGQGQVKARWTCDQSIPLKSLARATNLPRGRRTKIWAMCDVWDPTQQKYLGFGSYTAGAFLVTTDKAGTPVKVESADATPTGKLEGEESQVKLRHLKLKPGVKVYRSVSEGTFFVVAGRKAAVGDLGIVEAMGPPSKERHRADMDRAAELAKLRLANCWLVKTPRQYEALKKALTKKIGFTRSEGDPSSYGFEVTSGVDGFVVQALYYVPAAAGLHGRIGGVIYHQDMVVHRDGRIEARTTPCLTNGFYEGWGKMPPLLNKEAKAWDNMAREVLINSWIPMTGGEPPDAGLEIIPDRVTPKKAAKPLK